MPGVRGEGVKKKRWRIKLALCLLAGAVVTWGVAWGCALLRRPVYFRPVAVTAEGGSELWGSHQWGFGSESWFLAPARGSSGERLRVVPPAWAYVLSGCDGTTSLASGFPTRSVSVRLGYTSGGPGGPSQFVEGGQPLTFVGRTVIVPTDILPLGFALNTLFYAAVLLGVVEGVAFARRRARGGRGLCPSCGYDREGLAGGAACPECGRGARP